MSNIDRTTPVGLARYARDYFDAALAADDVLGKREGYEIVAPAPVMFLVAHSIELALKAYLRFTGVSIDDLKKVSHNLIECWQCAVDRGVKKHVILTEEDVDVLKIISDLHASTELRYMQTGYKTFPVFGPLESLAKKLLDSLCPLVGYK
jgi:hypothetical protein